MSELDQQVAQFHRDGFLIVPDALPADQVAQLLAGVRRAFEQEPDTEIQQAYGNLTRIWRPRLFEWGPEFEALIDNPRTIDLVEAILGPDCHLIAMSALRTPPGGAIDTWHIDEAVRFPLPPGVELDARIQMPCFVVNFNYYLCDVDETLGPTQFVPGSHRSGRQPQADDFAASGNPGYAGQGMVSAVGPAGTAVLWHDQTWHRGGPNCSAGRLRWVQQTPFGRRFIAQRFTPSIGYQMPEAILERANPRRRRLLGVHPAGAYG